MMIRKNNASGFSNVDIGCYEPKTTFHQIFAKNHDKSITRPFQWMVSITFETRNKLVLNTAKLGSS